MVHIFCAHFICKYQQLHQSPLPVTQFRVQCSYIIANCMFLLNFRNHLNDLENIPAFILVGILYVMIGPSLSAALWHFRLFFFSRVIHTICYQVPIPQPSRAVCFIVGVGCILSMCFQVMKVTF